MRRKRRWLWILLIVVLVLGSVLGGLLLTSSGARWVLRAVAPTHTVGEVTGHLIGPLTLSDVFIDAQDTIHIKRLSVDWSPSQLFRGRLGVSQLKANNVRVKIVENPTSDPVDPLDALRDVLGDWPLPIPVSLTHASVENLRVSVPDNQPIDIASIVVKGLSIDKTIRVDSMAVDAQYGTMNLHGSADIAASGRVEVVSTWRSRPIDDIPVTQGDVSIVGPWQALDVNQTLRAPVELSVVAQLLNVRSGTLSWQADAILPLTSLTQLVSSPEPLRLATRLKVSGDLSQFTAQGSGNVEYADQTVSYRDLLITGNQDHLTLQSVELTSSMANARIAGTVQLHTPTSWQLTLKANEISLASLDADLHQRLDEPVAQATVQWQGEGATGHGMVDISVVNNVFSPWHLTGKFGYQDDTLNVDRWLVNNVAHSQQQLRLDGQLSTQLDDWQQWPLSVKAQWESLQWPFPRRVPTQDAPSPRMALDAGQLALAGTLDDYQLQLDAKYLIDERVQGDVAMRGRGSTQHLDATSITTNVLGGQISGNALLSWQEDPTWKAGLTIDALKPQTLSADWPGDVSARIELTGDVVDESVRSSFVVSDITGTFLGYPVTGNLEAALNDTTWDITRSQLTSGESTLLLAGQYGTTSALDWQLVSKEMASLLPGATGRLAARGTINGRADTPRLRGTFEAEELSFQGRSLADAQGRFDVDFSGSEPWQLDARVNTIRLTDKIVIDALTATIDGDAELHRINVAATGRELGQLLLTGEGHLIDSAWTFATDQLDVTPAAAPTWHQQEPVQVSVEGQNVVVDRACLVQASQKICASASRTNDQTQSEVQITRFDLSVVNPWLSSRQMKIHGTIDGDVSAQHVLDGTMQFSGAFGIDKAQVTYIEEDSTRHAMPIRSVEANVEQTDHFAATVQGLLGEGGEFKGSVRVDDQLAALIDNDASIQGALSLKVPDVSALPFARISEFEVEGAVQIDAKLAGTAQDPQLQLDTRYRDGAVTIAQTGARLTDISIDATTSDEQTVVVDASLKASDKPVELKGKVHLEDIDQITASLTLTGERVPLVSLPEALVEASPQLTISIKDRLIETTGVIKIDRAQLRLEAAQSEVSLSDDVVIDSPTKAAPIQSVKTRPRRLRTRVTVQLGEEATIEAEGFVGRLSGSPVIVDKGDGLITAVGDISIVEGEYTIFGQTLPIESGRFSYADTDITNPLIDIAASREVEGVVARVRVTGSADNPRINFESQPPLQDSDVISYLLFSRPVAALSAADSVALVRLAASLRKQKKRKVPLRGKIAEVLGLPDLQFTVDSTQSETAVVVGSQLSSKFYLGYAIGLFDTASRLLLRYKLTDNLSVQSELGKSSGADLQYSLER